jgi:hypothetical protein
MHMIASARGILRGFAPDWHLAMWRVFVGTVDAHRPGLIDVLTQGDRSVEDVALE